KYVTGLIGKVLILCLLFCTGLLMDAAQAQRPDKPLSNLRSKTLPVISDTLQIDSLSIIPHTLSIAGVPDSTYTPDLVNGRLIWKQRPLLPVVTITYRVFPYRLNATAQRQNYDSVMSFFIG